MPKLIPIPKWQFFLTLVIGAGFVYAMSQAPEPEPPSQEKVEDYTQRMKQIINATEACHDEQVYTAHFDDSSLATDVLYNLTEQGFLEEDFQGMGGLFGNRQKVYCPGDSE